MKYIKSIFEQRVPAKFGRDMNDDLKKAIIDHYKGTDYIMSHTKFISREIESVHHWDVISNGAVVNSIDEVEADANWFGPDLIFKSFDELRASPYYIRWKTADEEDHRAMLNDEIEEYGHVVVRHKEELNVDPRITRLLKDAGFDPENDVVFEERNENYDTVQSDEKREALLKEYENSDDWIMSNVTDALKGEWRRPRTDLDNAGYDLEPDQVEEYKGEDIIFYTADQYIESKYSPKFEGDTAEEFISAIRRNFEGMRNNFGPMVIRHKEEPAYKKWLKDNDFDEENEIVF